MAALSARQLRRATADDAPALTRLINTAYEVEKYFVVGDRITESEVKAKIAEPNAVILVLDAPHSQTGLAGSVYVRCDGERAYFGLLAVDTDHQSRGVGRKLAIAAEQHGRACGCRFMDIYVVSLRKELFPFYRSQGYVETGTAPFAADEELKLPAHFVVMSKALRGT